MNIKNWEMFLESMGEDHFNRLKEDLLKSYDQIFISESILRSFRTHEIEGVVDNIINGLISGMSAGIEEDRTLPNDIKTKIGESFRNSLMMARDVMIDKSFKEGLSLAIDEFIKIIIALKKSMDSEGEEWKEEKVKGYEEMSNSELRDLIDIALDERDFGKVSRLSSFLKESVVLDDIDTDTQSIDNATEDAVSKLMSAIVSYFKS